MSQENKTPFSAIYDVFFTKITDDMYMELSKSETESMVQDLLINALSWFEFPRVNIFDYDLEKAEFNVLLTQEEINILAIYMTVEWFNQQLASIENTRMKYSGSDFKFTSQANHMQKVKELQLEYERKGFHLQRLYKRRKLGKDGVIHSTMGSIVGRNAY